MNKKTNNRVRSLELRAGELVERRRELRFDAKLLTDSEIWKMIELSAEEGGIVETQQYGAIRIPKGSLFGGQRF